MIYYTYRVETAAQAIRSAPFVFTAKRRGPSGSRLSCFWATSGTDRSVCSTTNNQDASEQCRKLEISMSVFSCNGKRIGRPKSNPNIRAPHERPEKIVYPTWPHVTRKQLGELAEMMFMVKATTKGLIVAKPYGDS